ncbi:hypothetical protein V2J09_017709 [Rumex salicifolius]
MMSATPSSRSNKFPFTATQWQELEHQALIYKYMVAGIPIPPDLLFSINRNNLDSSLTSKLFPAYQTSTIGWNPYQMGYGGKKIDPEPGRCRRTDGKKWRCSKEAYPDSKYCERHMHRGKNRSRKPVEVMAAAAATTTPTTASPAMMPSNTPTISPSFSVNKLQTANSSSSSFHPLHSTFQSANSDASFQYGGGGGRCHGSFDPNNFLYRPQGSIDQDSTSHMLYDSASFSRDRYLHGVKEDVAAGEHAFFTESSGATRRDLQSGYPYLELKTEMNSHKQAWGRDYGGSEASSMEEVKSSNEPRKTIHHFFDEWPPKGSRDSSPWHDSSTTQLSISIPNSSHDFFLSASTPHNGTKFLPSLICYSNKHDLF